MGRHFVPELRYRHIKMNAKSCCLLIVFAVLLLTTQIEAGRTNTRGISRLVGQQPLLFGRRGINPNMNSLMFGKRTPLDFSAYNEDNSDMCVAWFAKCEKYIASRLADIGDEQ